MIKRKLKDLGGGNISKDSEQPTLISTSDWRGVTGVVLLLGVFALAGLSAILDMDIPILDFLAGAVISVVSYYFADKKSG